MSGQILTILSKSHFVEMFYDIVTNKRHKKANKADLRNFILQCAIKQANKHNTKTLLKKVKFFNVALSAVSRHPHHQPLPPSHMKLIYETISPKPNMPENIISAISSSVLRREVLKADRREPFPVMKCLPLQVSLTSQRKCVRFISVGPLRSFLCGGASLRGCCCAALSQGAGVLLPYQGFELYL